MMYLLLIIGFVFLIKGADFFVDGCSSVAKLLKVPSVVIGLTVVSIGTSLPEASVSVTAGLSGSNSLALSNAIGSNIFNLLVVIGVCAAIHAFDTDEEILKRDIPVCFAASLLLTVTLLDGKLARYEGVLFLVLMVIYLVVVVLQAGKNRLEADEEVRILSPAVTAVSIIGGIAAIAVGGNLVVDAASDIAAYFGMSETLIGLTIVSVGTSLPELVTSIVASGKGESGLALGNAVGSSIFNTLFILGMSSALSPLAGTAENLVDIGVFLAVTVLIAVFCYTKKRVTRPEGAVCIAAYAVYLVYIIMR